MSTRFSLCLRQVSSRVTTSSGRVPTFRASLVYVIAAFIKFTGRSDRDQYSLSIADLRSTSPAVGASDARRRCDGPVHSIRAWQTIYIPSECVGSGASYEFQLIYVAASIDWNQYTLLMNVTWPNPSAEFSNYYHKTSGSWFDLWTQSLATGTLPPGEASDVREYQLRCEEVQQHEQQLSSVQNIQALIIQAVQRGARFRTSHKEGGTDIFWRGGHYVRSDFGENPSDQRYRHESKFLAMLFQFFQGEVIRNAPHGSLSELDAWRLILRQLKTNSD